MKFFIFHEGDLYLFKSDKEDSIDLDLLSSDIGLFKTEQDWELSSFIAICHNVDSKDFSMIRSTLRKKGYIETDLKRGFLESCYKESRNLNNIISDSF